MTASVFSVIQQERYVPGVCVGVCVRARVCVTPTKETKGIDGFTCEVN